MENNIENNLANSSNFLENINPKTPTECKIEFEKAKKMAYEGVMAMGKIAHIYKTNFCTVVRILLCGAIRSYHIPQELSIILLEIMKFFQKKSLST